MFFSVKTSIKIAGKVYSPCICYEAKEALIPTIEKLVADGKAYSFKERVYFQNGKVLVKKAELKQADSYEEPKRFEKKGKKDKRVSFIGELEDKKDKKDKKNKKEKTVLVKDVKGLAEEAEIIPSPEEIADNEGF